mmetsp:Transcript_18065/g.44255  ORF Transcript_18065/g.44255 Transcript_18065/m.44255 type:complete len:841 (+) Transcript_18065:369-2891(+)
MSYTSKEHLHNAIKKIHVGMNKKDWKPRYKAIEDLEKLIKSGIEQEGFPVVFEHVIKTEPDLKVDFAEQLIDLRSEILRQACQTVSTLAEALGDHMRELAIALMPNLMLASCTVNKVIRQYAIAATHNVIANVSSKHMLMPIINTIRETKSKQMRPIAMEFLEASLANWPTRMLSKRAVEIENTIAFGLECPTAQTRDAAARAFFLYLQHFPKKEKQAVARLPSRAAKIVERMKGNQAKSVAINATPQKESKGKGNPRPSTAHISPRGVTPSRKPRNVPLSARGSRRQISRPTSSYKANSSGGRSIPSARKRVNNSPRPGTAAGRVSTGSSKNPTPRSSSRIARAPGSRSHGGSGNLNPTRNADADTQKTPKRRTGYRARSSSKPRGKPRVSTTTSDPSMAFALTFNVDEEGAQEEEEEEGGKPGKLPLVGRSSDPTALRALRSSPQRSPRAAKSRRPAKQPASPDRPPSPELFSESMSSISSIPRPPGSASQSRLPKPQSSLGRIPRPPWQRSLPSIRPASAGGKSISRRLEFKSKSMAPEPSPRGGGGRRGGPAWSAVQSVAGAEVMRLDSDSESQSGQSPSLGATPTEPVSFGGPRKTPERDPASTPAADSHRPKEEGKTLESPESAQTPKPRSGNQAADSKGQLSKSESLVRRKSKFVSPHFKRHTFQFDTEEEQIRAAHSPDQRERSPSPKLFIETDASSRSNHANHEEGAHSHSLTTSPVATTSMAMNVAQMSPEKQAATQGLPMYLLMLKRYHKNMLDIYNKFKNDEIEEIEFAEQVLRVLHETTDKTDQQASRIRKLLRDHRNDSFRAEKKEHEESSSKQTSENAELNGNAS